LTNKISSRVFGSVADRAINIPEMQKKRDQTLRIYLPYLVGNMLFIDKSGNYVGVTYLRYFRDLELVYDYV